jgi:hypothetical protein
VAVDKDDTLTRDAKGLELFFGSEKIFPGAADFLRRQRDGGRRCIVASHAINSYRKYLAELEGLFDEFYGREMLDGTLRYQKPDGTLGYVSEDYLTKEGDPMDFGDQRYLSQAPPHEWMQIIHKHTQKRFRYKDRYKNPYNPNHAFYKDLFLLRQLLSDVEETRVQLKMVLVADPVDLKNSAGSDPETPMIAVDNKGKWLQRRTTDALLNFLLNNGASPSATFDAANGTGREVRLPLERSVLQSLIDSTSLSVLLHQKLVRAGENEFIFLRGKEFSPYQHLRAIIENTHEALAAAASTGT